MSELSSDVAAVDRALSYAAGTLAHLAKYVNDPDPERQASPPVQDPDLHEDLREAESWVIGEGQAAFARLKKRLPGAERDSAERTE